MEVRKTPLNALYTRKITLIQATAHSRAVSGDLEVLVRAAHVVPHGARPGLRQAHARRAPEIIDLSKTYENSLRMFSKNHANYKILVEKFEKSCPQPLGGRDLEVLVRAAHVVPHGARPRLRQAHARRAPEIIDLSKTYENSLRMFSKNHANYKILVEKFEKSCPQPLGGRDLEVLVRAAHVVPHGARPRLRQAHARRAADEGHVAHAHRT